MAFWLILTNDSFDEDFFDDDQFGEEFDKIFDEFDKHFKKDDLADCCLQGYYYMYSNSICQKMFVFNFFMEMTKMTQKLLTL